MLRLGGPQDAHRQLRNASSVKCLCWAADEQAAGRGDGRAGGHRRGHPPEAAADGRQRRPPRCPAECGARYFPTCTDHNTHVIALAQRTSQQILLSDLLRGLCQFCWLPMCCYRLYSIHLTCINAVGPYHAMHAEPPPFCVPAKSHRDLSDAHKPPTLRRGGPPTWAACSSRRRNQELHTISLHAHKFFLICTETGHQGGGHAAQGEGKGGEGGGRWGAAR